MNNSIEKRALWWLINGETGVSSMTLCAVMCDVVDPESDEYSHPWDSSDFARCEKLLELIPEWRKDLYKMADMSDEWANLVKHWDELRVLYQEEKDLDTAPKLYKRMKEVLRH